MKHPLNLISIRQPLQADKNGNFTDHGILVLTADEAVHVAYMDNTGFPPKNFPAGSMAEKQWHYNPRKRKGQMKLEDLLNG